MGIQGTLCSSTTALRSPCPKDQSEFHSGKQILVVKTQMHLGMRRPRLDEAAGWTRHAHLCTQMEAYWWQVEGVNFPVEPSMTSLNPLRARDRNHKQGLLFNSLPIKKSSPTLPIRLFHMFINYAFINYYMHVCMCVACNCMWYLLLWCWGTIYGYLFCIVNTVRWH